MILPGFDRARVLFTGEFDAHRALTELRETLADGLPAWWEVLKSNDRGAVLAGEVLGNQRIVVKTMRLDRPKDVISRLFRTTRLERQRRGAHRVAQAGLVTAEPRLMFRGRNARGTVVETLVLDRLPGETLLHTIAGGRADHARVCALARDVGRLTRALDDAGLFNRDHKPSNLIVLPEPFDPALALIDTVGVHRRRPSDRLGRMLANLVIELIGTGLTPAPVILARVLRAARVPVRSTWRRVEALVRAHGDPTPSEDPLGHPDVHR